MKKSLAKKKTLVKRKIRKKTIRINWRWLFFLLLLFVLVCLLVFFYKKPSHQFLVASPFEPLKKWVIPIKQKSKSEVESKKTIVANKEPESPVHYEFYSSLPNMHVSVADHPENSANNITVKKK